eukprot:831819-Pyramimonas_sp.AAC.1
MIASSVREDSKSEPPTQSGDWPRKWHAGFFLNRGIALPCLVHLPSKRASFRVLVVMRSAGDELSLIHI